MALESIVENAQQNQFREDKAALENEVAKLGEGANTSAHFSSRGYVVKPLKYDENAACPEDHLERVENLERFPWAELEKLDFEDTFDHAWVRMSPWDLSHGEAVKSYDVTDVIEEDLCLFTSLREHNITYNDFKPANIGYFWEDYHENSTLVAKAVDITDGARKPWEEEETLPWVDLSDILDVYIRGTPDEDGLVDRYPVQTQQAEEYVFDYLELDSEVTGDPYKDFFTAFDEHSSQIEDQVSTDLL